MNKNASSGLVSLFTVISSWKSGAAYIEKKASDVNIFTSLIPKNIAYEEAWKESKMYYKLWSLWYLSFQLIYIQRCIP